MEHATDNSIALVAFWNAANPIGTRVLVTLDAGSVLRTRTKSAAWMLGGHTAVIKVDGIAGGYLLNRVRPERGEG